MIPMSLLAICKGFGGFLYKYWRPLAVLTLLLLVWMHGDRHGTKEERGKWEYRYAILQKAAAEERAEYSEKARKQEQEWADFANLLAVNHQEAVAHENAKRDRIIADLRSGRLRFPAVSVDCQAAADPAPASDGAEGGQSGVVGEAITARFAACDEVTLERNLAVELLRAERR